MNLAMLNSEGKTLATKELPHNHTPRDIHEAEEDMLTLVGEDTDVRFEVVGSND